jgi:hypothetical protein
MGTNIVYKQKDGATVFTGSTDDLGQIISTASEVDVAPVMVCMENISDRALGASPFTGLLLTRTQVGANDGWTFVNTALDPNGTLSKPFGDAVDGAGVLTGGVTAAEGGAGGAWGGAGNHGVVVTAVNATGETVASVETVFNVADVGKKWLYTWKSLSAFGATKYRVYVTATPGDYPAARMQEVAPGSVTTLLDDGSTGSTVAPPTANTTGGAGPSYGTPPPLGSFTLSDKVITSGAPGLRVGEQFFFYFDAKIPGGSTAPGNKRQMRLFPKETS